MSELEEATVDSSTPMTNRQPARVLDSLLYEVFQATTMLLFLLSSITTNRQKQYVAPGVASPVMLPGLPELCSSPCINQVPDDDLYGPTGAAAQMVYKGWVAEVFGVWENRFRKELQATLGQNTIRPEMQAFGDLRYIRNDLFHNNGTASTERSGKCEILKWFTPGERIVLGTRHVFDFLNQTGVLSLGHAHDDASRSCSFEAYIFDSDGRNRLLQWRPKPKLISVRTQQEGKEADPPYKALTVVFDNGLFANVPCQVPDQRRWEALGDASVHSDSNLVFADGTVINSDQLYRSAVHEHEPRKPGDERPRLPVSGPPIRFRR